jgi:hypothetical protein
MASDASPGKIPATSLVHGSQAPQSVSNQQHGGKSLPPGGTTAIAAAAAAAAGAGPVPARRADPAPAPVAKPQPPGFVEPQLLVTQLNKRLNDSGRPEEFRVDPSNGKLIQQVNPATGVVVGEFSASEFPALARSVGATGLLVDSLA